MADAQGPGTDICGECGGPKEPSRHNSVKCRACDRAKRGRTYRLPLTVDETTWAALSDRAAAAGVSVYVMGRRVLRDALLLPVPVPVTSASPSTAPLGVPEKVLVDRCVRWMQATDRVKPDTIKTKSALLAWCVSEGFKP